ncbi:unnamed protein product [Leptosia nina]|uniref:Uncharacterized protein n=1 Tax=Leptosia nina TaxID=320188 RepID=A0AAV1JMJ3_9NEOP
MGLDGLGRYLLDVVVPMVSITCGASRARLIGSRAARWVAAAPAPLTPPTSTQNHTNTLLIVRGQLAPGFPFSTSLRALLPLDLKAQLVASSETSRGGNSGARRDPEEIGHRC